MTRRWRLFRQDAGRISGPGPVAYIGLYLACIAVGYFNVAQFGSVVIWPANGVLLAALLQLHRRPAILTLAVCVLINMAGNQMRGDALIPVLINPLLNLAQVMIAALIARRLCGAALDMRRPQRLARFAFLATLPAALAVATFGVFVIYPTPPLDQAVAGLTAWFSIDLLGLWIVTPTLLIMARSHRFSALHTTPLWEKIAWPGLLAGATAAVFAQPGLPVMFLIFPPLLLVAFRLAPGLVGASVMMVAIIGVAATLTGNGPVIATEVGDSLFFPAELSPVLRVMPVFYLFMSCVLFIALPVSTSLTERRRLEQRLKARAQAAVEARLKAEDAAQARSRFLAMMSHEMRTPLNGVSGYAAILAANPYLDAETRRQVELISASSDGLLRIVDDILDFSRGVVELDDAPFAVAEVVEQIMERGRPAAETKGLMLRLVEPIDPQMRHRGDGRRIGQVLAHLVGNAIKFSERGAISVAVLAEANGLAVFVSDQGRGLGDIEDAELFQPFAQADASISRTQQGAGMGLAVCRRMIDAMNGEIHAGPSPSGGALFWFRIPLARLPDSEAVPAPVAFDTSMEAPVMDRAPRVLVVDDHPVNREVAGLMLTAAGCEITYACDGSEAVEAAGATAYDLILMDVRMPKMDGLAATRAIRALEPRGVRTPIVAMTADAMPEDVVRCLAAGMDEHLAKPVNQAGLVEAVQRALERGRLDAAAAA